MILEYKHFDNLKIWCFISWPTGEIYALSKTNKALKYYSMGGSRAQGVRTSDRGPLENHMLLYFSLEILVRSPLEKQLDPLGPIASREKSVWPSVKYVD